MSICGLIFLPAAAALAVLTCGEAAQADLLIEIDKTAQRMTITLDGHEVHKWTVATGGIDYDTPNGVFKPFRMEIDHHSDEWDNAPMPYSIFFTMTGNAIHGTYEGARSGTRCRTAACGCRWPTPPRYGG
jgi:lipoprotein-anchoring transpeptidase ErfK/SrfK